MKKKEKLKSVERKGLNNESLSDAFKSKLVINTSPNFANRGGSPTATACDIGHFSGDAQGALLFADFLPDWDSGPGTSPCDEWLA
jgi:hypothetical protein